MKTMMPCEFAKNCGSKRFADAGFDLEMLPITFDWLGQDAVVTEFCTMIASKTKD
jgi:hypothetical protein